MSKFTEIINQEKPVLVDFFAEWCGPCKMIGPVVEQLAGEYDGKAVIAKVDVDSNPEISAKFGIRSIPTLLFFDWLDYKLVAIWIAFTLWILARGIPLIFKFRSKFLPLVKS